MRAHAAALNGAVPFPMADLGDYRSQPIVFSTADAERWADYSGDHNPIHFDIEQARLLNVDWLVVHGMVALLPIRQRIAQWNEKGNANAWRRLRVMFRLPVPQDTELALAVNDDGGALRFGLRPVGARQDHIRAQYACDMPPPALPRSPALHVPHERIMAFVDRYGAALPAWMALEAAVFAELVQSDTDPIWEIVRRHAVAAWGDLSARPMVVHASHKVWHRDQSAFYAAAKSPAVGSVEYACGPVAVDAVPTASRKSLSCRIPLIVTIAGQLALQIEVGLLVIEAPDPG